MSTKIAPLPIIDITPFTPGSQADAQTKASVAQELAAACTSYGAFYLPSTGNLTSDFRQEVFQASRDFFALPDDIKRAISIKRGGFTRGYVGIGGESGSTALEVKEAFSYGYPWPHSKNPHNNLQGPNIWPDTSALQPNWQSTLESFFSAMVQVAEAVTRALSVALGMDEDYLPSYCTEGDTISLMRLFHYFPYKKADNISESTTRIGSSPHTDWGFLTLILQQEGVTGLQVADDKGEWVDVPPIAGTLLVNAGDYLSLLTNGRIVSPLHRVMTGSEERLSAVFFYYPNYYAKIPKLSADGTTSEISLFVDQRDQSNGEHADTVQGDLSTKSFGQYIADKWNQVYR